MEKPEAIEPAIIKRSQDLVRRLNDRGYDFDDNMIEEYKEITLGLRELGDLISVYDRVFSVARPEPTKVSEARHLLDEAWIGRLTYEAEKMISALNAEEPDPLLVQYRRFFVRLHWQGDSRSIDLAERMAQAWNRFLPID